MSIITRVLRQKAVYWAPSSTIGYDGRPSGWDSPVEIDVRWSNKERYHTMESGIQVISQSEVMTGPVATEKGGFLMLGTLLDVTSGIVDPRDQVGAYEIMKNLETPNIRNTETYRKAFLTWQK